MFEKRRPISRTVWLAAIAGAVVFPVLLGYLEIAAAGVAGLGVLWWTGRGGTR